MKTCTKCGETKPLEEFPLRVERGPNARYSRCQPCHLASCRERTQRWRERHPEKARAKSTEASRKLRAKDPEYFRRWYWANAEKERARSRDIMRKDRAEHPERERGRKRRYRAKHLEAVRTQEREKTYARRALQPYSPELAELMAHLVTQPCVYCGATENITIDHIVPLSRGGKHEAGNLTSACLPCNCSKNNLLLSEWNGRLSTRSPG